MLLFTCLELLFIDDARSATLNETRIFILLYSGTLEEGIIWRGS
jgi:hypothetical protein